jgi:hypothetical protein
LVGNEEYARIAQICLDGLARARDVHTEQIGGYKTYLVREEDETYRIAIGQDIDTSQLPRNNLIVVGWGSSPMAFLAVPDSEVVYFDLKFETHSRHLNQVASELRNCLETQGCKFREFVTEPPKPPPVEGRYRRRITRLFRGQRAQ